MSRDILDSLQPPVVLKSLAQFNQYSKSHDVLKWTPDGHPDPYVFAADAHSDYWHVRCPSHERTGDALRDSQGFTVTFDCGTRMRIHSVHTHRKRSVAIVYAGEVGEVGDVGDVGDDERDLKIQRVGI